MTENFSSDDFYKMIADRFKKKELAKCIIQPLLYFIIAILFLYFMYRTRLLSESTKILLVWFVAVCLESITNLIADLIVYR